MDINLWVSTDEVANWLIDNTIIKNFKYSICKLVESDANNRTQFHRIPEAIKRILYYDAVDIIIEFNSKPILAIEISHEAGTGHNVFQRFARIVAAVENDVPVAYIYPEAAFVHRNSNDRWDKINPNIFKALERVMQIHNIPALIYYYPTEFDGDCSKAPSSAKGLIHDSEYFSSPNHEDIEMKNFFHFVNEVIETTFNCENNLINKRLIVERRQWMQNEFLNKGGTKKIWSPETTTITVPTSAIIKYLKKYCENNHDFGSLLESREETVVYITKAKFRNDPYPGALSTVDYLKTRIGNFVEDRDKNLVMSWFDFDYDKENDELIVKDGQCSVNDFMKAVTDVTNKNNCLLSIDNFNDLKSKSNSYMVSRYFMQVNHGCTYTKKKEIRIFSAFSDAILFKDGALWKEG